MAKQKSTLIAFVLDETGSMLSCYNATVSGYNEYINELKKDGKKTKFTLTKFNSQKVEIVHDAVKMADVPEIDRETYQPAAMTPLYDAIGQTVRATEKSLDKKTSVLFVIMTDGQENHSQEYCLKDILALVKGKEKDGWTFAYLGANQDAWLVSQAIGFQKGNTMTYDTAKTKETFSTLAAATTKYRSRGSVQTSTLLVED